MVTTVSKWGNSQGIRVPKDILDTLNLKIGDTVEIVATQDQAIIKPTKTKKEKISIEELVKKIPKNYKPYEEFSDKTGVESW